MKRILEICCTSLEDAKIASDNGADRIELCEDLEVGGVTPNLKLLESVLNNIALPVFVLVRPRGGHFFYNYDELDIMLASINDVKNMGAKGIVSGALNSDKTIDSEATLKLINFSEKLPFTFHRAFDECVEVESSMKLLRSLGVNRILSSAGLTKASDDHEKISKIVKLSQSKPRIICCGGIRSSNIKYLLNIPELVEFHSAASSNIKGVDPKEVNSIRSQIDNEIEL